MAKKNPNIVLILADNLGWGELGCYGGGMSCGGRRHRASTRWGCRGCGS